MKHIARWVSILAHPFVIVALFGTLGVPCFLLAAERDIVRRVIPGEVAMDSEAYLFSLVGDIQAREAERGFDSLTPKEKTFFCVWALEADVNNGGFFQYFQNSAGDHALQTPEALRAIGAAKAAALVESANAVFAPSAPSPDFEVRLAQVDQLPESARDTLSRLDEIFFTYPDNLSELLARYMRA